ncbi:MFS transporter [Luteolibacter sp. LG18]|uniref:MFS transporter n=1 Tax=Luteolibacter sp. LG18 TaxID=2819286 RepID=UPI002B30D0A8|nr:fosmidomycin resistance protein [Luteolibacter sp. LG18]
MQESCATPTEAAPSRPVHNTVFALLFAISFSHMLNDTIQALLPSIYPILKDSYGLNFTQLGLITFTFQVTASLLQPVVGFLTDRKPMPYSLPIGMSLTLIGLISLSRASSFPMILMSAAMVGGGSAVFHPEASRIAHMAAGKRRGLAQSLFQVGGNMGSSFGPLLAALVIVPHGQGSISWFSVVALLGVVVLFQVGRWQAGNLHRIQRKPKPTEAVALNHPSRRTVVIALLVLVALTFSKYVYLSSLTSYYTFYLIDRFHVSVQSAQYHLFLLLFAVAAGTIIGGPVGDRFGRKRVIWGSILGVAPFSLWLPHAGLGMTAVLSVIIGLVLASAFSAILVYAQELLPGKVGMIAGLFFGLAFGIAGIGSAVLGKVADHTGINYVFQLCAYLPLLGLLTVFLPDVETKEK